METIWEAVLENLKFTGFGFALFVICYLSNMAFSIWYNTKILNEEFDWNRILNSGLKILAFGIGTVLMCIGATTIPTFCEYLGLVIPQEYAEVFEKLAIISVFIYSACKYLFEAYGKFKKILSEEEIIVKTQE